MSKSHYKSGRQKPEWHSRDLIEEDSAKWFFIAGAVGAVIGVIALIVVFLSA